jgi:hypothetical protein
MQAYGVVREGKVATVVFEQQNIYNNTNINVDNTSNNNVGK